MKKKRLLWQLYPTYLFIIIISLVAVSIYSSRSFKEFFIEDTIVDLQARAKILKSQIGQIMATKGINVDARIDNICKLTGKNSQTRVTVILPSGKVIGDSDENPETMEDHSGRPEIVKAFKGKTGVNDRFSTTLNMHMMYVAIPVEKGSDLLGILRVSIPLSKIDNKLNTIMYSISFSGFLIAILAACLCFFVSRKIVKPIEQMKEGAKKFSEGKFEHKLYIPESEEIGELAESMNEMARQLDERINIVESQRNELEAVLSSMVEGVLAIDRNKKIISMNHAATAFFGGNRSDYKGKSINEIVRNISFQKLIERSVDKSEVVQEDITFKRNKARILNVRSTSLRDATNSQIGTLIIFNDVTNLRNLENMRRDFAANVSHEIKTPLTAIKGFVETLNNVPKSNHDEIDRFLDIIGRNVNRLNLIIEDLLKLSRIESDTENGKIELEKGKLSQVINNSVNLCSHQLKEKNIEINININDKCEFLMDEFLLERAFVNIIDNAFKYSDEGDKIHIESFENENEIHIKFTDFGIGIPEKNLSRLFERFYRVDKARSRKMGGTGLGLAIVKHIMVAHEGAVTVESKVGVGTMFTLIFPKIDSLYKK
ncbi:MAG: cell wall metabolism sensor histidine kinase WalK [Desulfobacterales bacterium]|nr:cell wall metabolism sensor histidine kinase WalK [Desulfobacterales bacterium]MCP4162171.1 cell wall metabolism sensor histidine kinase WalK [Deltaproteobacteria bacterium]